jgi:hypothetical protein
VEIWEKREDDERNGPWNDESKRLWVVALAWNDKRNRLWVVALAAPSLTCH